MLDVACRRLQRTELHHVDLLEDSSFLGRRFNLITAFRFFVNAEPVLRAGAIRVLEPLLADDGYFVFNNHQNMDAPYTRLSRGFARLRHRSPRNALSMAQCDDLLAGAGLEIVRVYPVGTFRLPRIHLPHGLYRSIDTLAGYSRTLTARSECPVIVARRSIRS